MSGTAIDQKPKARSSAPKTRRRAQMEAREGSSSVSRWGKRRLYTRQGWLERRRGRLRAAGGRTRARARRVAQAVWRVPLSTKYLPRPRAPNGRTFSRHPRRHFLTVRFWVTWSTACLVTLRPAMVKKGQSKGGKPGGGQGASKPKPSPATAAGDDSFIVFSNSDKDPKARKPPNSAAAGSSAQDGPALLGEAPKRPDVKKLIGGASWTGKLPVNMLSEHCQKQKWEKPEYTMVRLQQYYPGAC